MSEPRVVEIDGVPVDVFGDATDEQVKAMFEEAIAGEPDVLDDPIEEPELENAELANVGFEGHAGRPGQVGGSAPREGSGAAAAHDKQEADLKKRVHEIAAKEIDPNSKRAKALASFNPVTKEKREISKKYETNVATAVKGVNLKDNEPPDVVKGRHAIEVKTIVDGKNPKITMHGEALARKVKYGRVNKVQWHTVAIDARGDEPVYYYKQGIGSFRLKNMEPVSLKRLGEIIK